MTLKDAVGSWWLSVRGRRVVRGVALVGVGAAFLRHYLPNTHLLSYCQDITQLYRNGSAVKESPKVSSLVQSVLEDLRLDDTERSRVSSYTVYGFDLFRAGTTLTRSGGIVGIPLNFKYTSEKDFDHTGIVVNNDPVPWSTPSGQSLKASLILSEEAKKFAIAREVASLRSGEPFMTGSLASTVVAMVYFISSTVNKKMNFYARPRALRVTWYTLVGLFGCTYWALGKDVSTVGYETEADKLAGELGESYARGGLEYYDKILQRNIALRSLMGEAGEKLYTAYGNDEVLIRTRHQPYTERRDNLKACMEKYQKGGEGESSTTTATPITTKSEDVGKKIENDVRWNI